MAFERSKSKKLSSPTSYDVARRAGVSQSAVSRCFRPGKSVSKKTRDKILAAAKELGYQPNAIAQGLITKRSNLVAVVISNLTNLAYPEVLAELTQRLSARGIRVLLFTLASESEVAEALDQIWRYRVDGAIVAARLSDDQLSEFAERGVPVVLYNRVGGEVAAASVRCDSVSGEAELIDALVSAGHRHFGIIAGPSDSYVGQERVSAAVSRLEKHGLKASVVPGNFDYSSGGDGLRELVRITASTLDAVVCANDLLAIGAIDFARFELNLNVPEDISIVGFDGVGPARWRGYQLTTIRQPVRRMTDAAVAMLIDRIEQADLPPEQRVFAGEFLIGTSARTGA